MRTVVTLLVILFSRVLSNYVVFYGDKSSRGSSCTDMSLSNSNIREGCLRKIGNDKIRSVRVCGNRCVRMWSEHSWRGKYWKVCSYHSGGCRSMNAGDGRVSSYKIMVNTVKDCTVTLCEHNHKPGKCCSKGAGSYDIHALSGSCPGNDRLSSVEINGRCKVHLYENSGFRGRSFTLNGPGYWSYRSFKNDAVSSFRIIKPCTVTLCEHDHKPGKCCSKRPGSYDIDTLSGSCPGNDHLSLIRIQDGCTIRLYEHSGYGGRSYTINGPGSFSFRHGRFPNDRISSFKITNTRRRLEEGGDEVYITANNTN